MTGRREMTDTGDRKEGSTETGENSERGEKMLVSPKGEMTGNFTSTALRPLIKALLYCAVSSDKNLPNEYTPNPSHVFYSPLNQLM